MMQNGDKSRTGRLLWRRPPWGVVTLGLFLLAIVALVVITTPPSELGFFGFLFLLGLAAFAIGLLLVRPWAWWIAVICAGILAFSSLIGLLSRPNEDEALIPSLLGIAAGGTLLLYLFTGPIKGSFIGQASSSHALPKFSTGLIVTIALFLVLAVIAVWLATLSGMNNP